MAVSPSSVRQTTTPDASMRHQTLNFLVTQKPYRRCVGTTAQSQPALITFKSGEGVIWAEEGPTTASAFVIKAAYDDVISNGGTVLSKKDNLHSTSRSEPLDKMRISSFVSMLLTVHAVTSWNIYLYGINISCGYPPYQLPVRIVTGSDDGACNTFGKDVGDNCYEVMTNFDTKSCPVNKIWRPRSAKFGGGTSTCQIYARGDCIGTGVWLKEKEKCHAVSHRGFIQSFRCWTQKGPAVGGESE
ncbi:hypothetical protein P154DRAFT_539539 [Amniculicola lignicola CBS 123094]|uniref:Uncharacterized protein n=1 Tax=Amniculicola lignicola CBS 123094 TaxID=1392246 RepID=A0A6A5VYI8_9PLEO|nr:hypothetical protein P154DRAFT_539539 [Amniculicola lignicola CBS 123094]